MTSPQKKQKTRQLHRLHHSARSTISARATVCCFRTQSPPVTFLRRLLRARSSDREKHARCNKMPWRDLIFTDAGVVYPASWSKSKQDRVTSVSMAPTRATSFADTPTQDPSGRIASQDLFSRRDSAPKSPAAPPSLRPAAPAKSSSCTALLSDAHQAPQLRCSPPTCSERQPQKGYCSPLASRSGKTSRTGLRPGDNIKANATSHKWTPP